MKADLEAAIAALRADLYRALWMQGAAIVAVVLAAKLLRPARDRVGAG